MPRGRWVLFETGPFTQDKAAAGNIKAVPVPYNEHSNKLATKWGRLMHELLVAPVPILIAMRKLLNDVAYAPLLTPPLASWHALLTPPLAW